MSAHISSVAITADIKLSETSVEVPGDDGKQTPDGAEPTEYELTALRKVSDKVPLSAWLVCVVETAERFTYYGVAGPFRTCGNALCLVFSLTRTRKLYAV